MAAEITGVNFEEKIRVNRITSGINIDSHTNPIYHVSLFYRHAVLVCLYTL